ncbi:MAG: ABC transporter permease [Candidatus Eisenbacteria sp.]|nr:ABC transporter permease [Candidatus Eisenbacteria bacterium]
MTGTSTLRIAWRNLGRNRKRSSLALAAIALGQFVFLAVAALMHGYMSEFHASITGPLIGHAQIHAEGWLDDRSIDLAMDGVTSVLDEVRGDPDVEHVSARIYAPVLTALTEEGFMSFVVGVDPVSESHDAGLLPGLDAASLMGEGRVLIGSGFARRYDIEKGAELALFGQDIDGSIASGLFTVTEIISPPVDIVNNLGIVMTLDDAGELLAMYDQAHEIVIHTRDLDTVGETVARLSALPALTDLELLHWREVVPEMVIMFDLIDVFLFVVLGIVFVAAAAGIANTMLMATFERKHEFGMLLSLGCGPGRLARMITVEAVILGLMGVAIGTALGFGLLLITQQTGLDYAALGGATESYEAAYKGVHLSSLVYPKLYASDVLAGMTAVFLTSLLSVVWPIMRIARLEPMEAMRL